jgi:hypothetical protein
MNEDEEHRTLYHNESSLEPDEVTGDEVKEQATTKVG